MIKSVTIWQNSNVMAFNEHGQQVPECQGSILNERVRRNLKKYCDVHTEFRFGDWNTGRVIEASFRHIFEKKRR